MTDHPALSPAFMAELRAALPPIPDHDLGQPAPAFVDYLRAIIAPAIDRIARHLYRENWGRADRDPDRTPPAWETTDPYWRNYYRVLAAQRIAAHLQHPGWLESLEKGTGT